MSDPKRFVSTEPMNRALDEDLATQLATGPLVFLRFCWLILAAWWNDRKAARCRK